MSKMTDDVLDRAVEAALNADIIALDGDLAGQPGVRLMEYLTFTPDDAIELGVCLSEKTPEGKPRFHWYSDIRGDEHDDVARAILRPLIRAALEEASKE